MRRAGGCADAGRGRGARAVRIAGALQGPPVWPLPAGAAGPAGGQRASSALPWVLITSAYSRPESLMVRSWVWKFTWVTPNRLE